MEQEKRLRHNQQNKKYRDKNKDKINIHKLEKNICLKCGSTYIRIVINPDMNDQ
jgi:hypothetical protein